MSKIKQNDDQSLTDIDIFIDEKPTGEVSAGAGYGTDGTTFQIGIKENNFNGKGINLAANLELGEDSVKGLLAYTHQTLHTQIDRSQLHLKRLKQIN